MTMEDPEIPSTGAIFTFGKSKFADNAPSKFWIKNDEVKLISCGDEHTAVVTQSGRLFTFGCNEWGQLGLGHNNNVIKPSCVKVLKPDQVVAVSCGRYHTVVAMRSGQVWAMGCNSEGQLGVGRGAEWLSAPQKVPGLPHHVVQLAAGASHSMALTAEGKVFVWGSNTEGQLGLGGESEETVHCPTQLSLEVTVSEISCGYYHSALVTTQGHLLTFGEEEGGKLGLGEEGEETDTPQEVTIPGTVSSARCGASHTLVLTTEGKVFSFGQSSHGQLGLGNKVLEADLPQLLISLDGLTVVSLSCGENHSLVSTSTGHLYTFGDGRHGKLCLDLETLTNQFSPTLVDRFRGFRVSKAECGGCHTMVLAVPVPDYDPTQEHHQARRVSEVNSEARERRRSGLKEESRLPPIRSKLAPLPQRVEEPDESSALNNDNQQDPTLATPAESLADIKENHQEEKENEETEIESPVKAEADLKEDKSAGSGRISKFFSSFKRKKQTQEEDKTQINGVDHEDNNEENVSPTKSTDSQSKEPSPEKGKKRVSFFRQFSKEKKEEDKKEIKQKIILKPKEERLMREEEEEQTSENNENEKEEDEDEDLVPDDKEDDEESETDSDVSELSTTPGPALKRTEREESPVKGISKPVVKIINPTTKPNNTKVKSKSCVII